MLNIKCNKTTFTFLQASLSLQFEERHWLIFHVHFHYIWRWKLYGCIRGGTRRRDSVGKGAAGMVPALAAPVAWCGDVRVIHFKRLDYKVGDGIRIHPPAPLPRARHGSARCTVVHQFTNWLMVFLSLPSENWAWLIRSHFSYHHEICKILPI